MFIKLDVWMGKHGQALHTVHFLSYFLIIIIYPDGSGELNVSINVTYSRPSDFTKEHPYYRAGSVVTLTCYVDGIQGQGLRYVWTSNCSGNCLAGKSNSQSITLTALSSSHSGLYTCTVWEGNTCTGNTTIELSVAGKLFMGVPSYRYVRIIMFMVYTM